MHARKKSDPLIFFNLTTPNTYLVFTFSRLFHIEYDDVENYYICNQNNKIETFPKEKTKLPTLILKLRQFIRYVTLFLLIIHRQTAQLMEELEEPPSSFTKSRNSSYVIFFFQFARDFA